MRKFALLILTLSALQANAQFPTDPRSDSLDILKQHIKLNITDFTNRIISGSCDIRFKAITNNVQGITLDLHEFTVDSVTSGNQQLSFSYAANLLHIPFQTAMNNGDSTDISVWYHGEAQQGSGGWGGFYWNQGIAFNMGVTLFDIPHNAGRFWFPCFDNFTEKGFYEVTVTTQPNHVAVCGGFLISEIENPDLTKTWHWKLNQSVPSYLVSVAVGPFTFVEDTYAGTNGNIPVMLAALASDTTALKNSFQNLEASFEIYEEFYGPYLWDRIGYVVVPFTGGAMEHATNVAYQRTLIDGATTYESVMAHELSHHWWGDLVTCETAEDMWINEGMAVFSEYLFLEQLYGRPTAISALRSSHSSVIKTAHISDDDYHPLNGVPQEHTYGKHSYDKGGNVAWSLRGYMGDELFFKGLKAILKARPYGNVNALEFRDIMTDSTGYDVGPFFDDWFLQPGFTEFLLDSFTVSPAGNQFNVEIRTSQRLREADHLYTQVPLEISFIGPQRQVVTATHTHSGLSSLSAHVVPFAPVAVFINRSQKLFYAVTADEKEVKTTGTSVLSYSNFRLSTETVTDSALVRSEYHWAAPEQNLAEPWKYEITPDRFWKIDGIFPSDFTAAGIFAYDGSNTGPDNIIYTEDSVLVFYRKNIGDYWRPAPNQTLNKQALGDKKGNVSVKPLIKGEYCIGTRRATVGIWESDNQKTGNFSIAPNPNGGIFRLVNVITGKQAKLTATLTDSAGKRLKTFTVAENGEIDLSELASGTYYINLKNGQDNLGTVPVLIKK